MRKLLSVLGLAAGIAYASSPLAAPLSCTSLSGSGLGISCTCASGTCDAPASAPTKPTSTGTATASVRLGPNVTSIDVRLCPSTGTATITASKVDVWFYDANGWGVFGASYSGTTSRAAGGCVWLPFDSPGKGMPIISSRAAWAQVVPSGTTLSAGGVTVEVYPSGPSGSL